MGLSSDLISQFVKATKDTVETKKETTVYGQIVEKDGELYVKLDGSELLTPITKTTNVSAGDKVLVTIKNHTAIVTGNITDPSAQSKVVHDIQTNVDGVNKKVNELGINELSAKLAEFEIIVANSVQTDEFDAQVARIDELRTENTTIKGTLTAYDGSIKSLQAEDVTIKDSLAADKADISQLKTGKLDAQVAEATYATIKNLDATNTTLHSLEADYGDFASLTTEKLEAAEASMSELDTKKLSAESAAITYATIDFSNIGKAAIEQFISKSGLIENAVIGDGTITGVLVGVTIKGDLIEGNTIVADKLVIQGEDGLYYKLNTDGVTTEAEQTEYNSLNGSVITAKSITATQISVDDLVAFDATIGGFKITEDSIYSEVKDAEGNTTRGIYMDTDGQINFGDASNFIKYYRDESGNYKLAISADSILYALNGKQHSVEDLGLIGEYVHVGVYEGEPCIELGESDSDFKLIITNTRILFMEGSSVPAYINNQSLHITKAVIEEEIQQGEFVWKVRQNGNMGLMWKGADS